MVTPLDICRVIKSINISEKFTKTNKDYISKKLAHAFKTTFLKEYSQKSLFGLDTCAVHSRGLCRRTEDMVQSYLSL